jgi:hypothetical protein
MQDHPPEHLRPSSAELHLPRDNRDHKKWDTPWLSSTYLDSLPFRLAFARFLHVLNVLREPLLGPPHSHTLYPSPTNRSSVTSTHILPRFVRLLVNNSESPRVKKTIQATFVMESRVIGLVLVACLMLPCLVPLILWSIRTIIEATTERKTAAHVMMIRKYKPLNQDDAL